MTVAFEREKIRLSLEHDEDGLHQALLNIAYHEWQKHRSWHMEDMITYAREYGEIVELAVLVGKYNQQVTNGGHSQYFYNGYGGCDNGENICYTESNYDTPLTRRMEELLLKYKLNELSNGGQIISIVKDFINRTHAWDDQDITEDECPDYDDLDTAYYIVNETWMEKFEQYLKSWMEFNEDPITNGRY